MSTKKNNKKTKETKKIGAKNYVILGVIIIVTLVIVICLRNYYISYENYQLTVPVLKGKLNEVTSLEIDNYLTENTDVILYIEVTDDDNSREVADDLYDVVKERNLVNEVVYISLGIDEIDNFLSEFNEKYNDQEDITSYPALVLIEESKVKDYVSRTDNQRLNIGDVEQLFDEYELEGD